MRPTNIRTRWHCRRAFSFVRVENSCVCETCHQTTGPVEKVDFGIPAQELIPLDLFSGLAIGTGSFCFTLPLFPAVGVAHARIACL